MCGVTVISLEKEAVMSRSHAQWLACFVGAFLLLSAGPLRADEPSAGGAVPREQSLLEARIEQALTEPVEFEFLDTPLTDVVAFIADSFSIPVYLDGKALEDAGVTPDTPITFQAREIKLESALNLMLGQLEIGFTIENEMLLISTAEELNSTMEIRVYPVGDLLAKNDSLNGRGQDEFADLMDVITATIEPESWCEVGGPGSIESLPEAGALVLAQTRDVHRQVEQLLHDLRRAKTAKASHPPADAPAASSEGVTLKYYRLFKERPERYGAVALPRNPTSTLPVGALFEFAPRPKEQLDRPTTWELELAHAIEATVAPETWKAAGGEGLVGAIPSVLLVRQTPQVHAQIARLLRELGYLR
jgi:hypothetical protein